MRKYCLNVVYQNDEVVLALTCNILDRCFIFFKSLWSLHLNLLDDTIYKSNINDIKRYVHIEIFRNRHRLPAQSATTQVRLSGLCPLILGIPKHIWPFKKVHESIYVACQ